jgi:prepilin-type processing-associated H-X9-DG protein
VLFEGADYGRTVEDDHVHTSTWYAPVDVEQGTVIDVMIAEINPTQHVTCANYLYADGHAETVSFDTFLSWVQADIAAGTNFARPQQ